MFKKYLFVIYICLISLFICSCDQADNMSASLEQIILSDMIKKYEDIFDTEEGQSLILQYRQLLNDKKISADEINIAINNLTEMAEDILNKKIVFIDGSVERKVKLALGKKEADYLTYSELLSIESLDCSYTEEDKQNGYSSIYITDDFENMPNLVSLNLSGNSIMDFSSLSKLENLEKLDLSYTGLIQQTETETVLIQNAKYLAMDLKPIESLIKLQHLNLAGCNLYSTDIIKPFVNLKYLDLSNNPISDFTALSSLESLNELIINDVSFNDFSIFSELKAIERLTIKNSTAASLFGIEKLQNLKYLNLCGTKAGDFQYISTLSSLSELILTDTGVTDISFLSGMKLTHLNVSKNQLVDASVISTLKELISADLSENNLTYLILSDLLNLMSLNVNNNNISNIVLRNELPMLSKLCLSSNALTDIDLSLASGLSELYLQDNKLKSSVFLANLLKLKKLYLDRNQITEFTNLSAASIIELSLEAVPLTSTAGLINLAELSMLNLWDTAITDVIGLAGMNKLKDLKIGLKNVSDYTGLEGAVNVENLEVFGATDEIWHTISSFYNLKTISIERSSISSIKLQDMNYLKTIKVSVCRLLEDLSQLLNLPLLEELYINYAGVNIPAISGLSGLKYLTLIDAKVEKLSLITDLPALEYINLSENETFEELTFEYLPSLKIIDLSKNKLDATDLKSLNFTMNMGTLYLNDNNIKNLKNLKLDKDKLSVLDVSNNKISDFSPIYDFEIKTVLWSGNKGEYNPPETVE